MYRFFWAVSRRLGLGSTQLQAASEIISRSRFVTMALRRLAMPVNNHPCENSFSYFRAYRKI
jgi:hypothetical protein